MAYAPDSTLLEVLDEGEHEEKNSKTLKALPEENKVMKAQAQDAADLLTM